MQNVGFLMTRLIYELKPEKITHIPSEDSDQFEHSVMLEKILREKVYSQNGPNSTIS